MARTYRSKRVRGGFRRRGRGIKTSNASTRLTDQIRQKRRRATIPEMLQRYGPAAARLGVKAYRIVRNSQSQGQSVKRQRTEKDAGGFMGGQLSKYSFRMGQKKTGMQLLTKLAMRDMTYRIERYGGSNRLHDPTGGFFKFDYTGLPNAIQYFPAYFLDLTTREAVGTSIAPFTRMISSNGDNNTYFTSIAGRNSGNTGSTTSWDSIKSNSYSAPITSGEILEWTSAKFMFRAPTSRPGYFKVVLFQLVEGDHAPLGDIGGSTGSTQRTSTYNQIIKPYLYNPIFNAASSTYPVSKQIRVIKTWQKNYSPDSVDNKDTNGQQIRMDLFLRHNRYCQFRSKSGNRYALDENLDAPFIADQQDADTPFNYLPDPKARLYLGIFCTNFDAMDAGGLHDPTVNGSFDMEVRHKYVHRSDL